MSSYYDKVQILKFVMKSKQCCAAYKFRYSFASEDYLKQSRKWFVFVIVFLIGKGGCLQGPNQIPEKGRASFLNNLY
jgi:hypothetical protein